MRMFMLIDENNIVRDKASSRDNLSKKKIDLCTLIEIKDDMVIRYGDEYDPETGTVTTRPENYPQQQLTEKQQTEAKIQTELRTMAIERLKEKGELSADYKE